jgi:hypothetical protein
MPELEDCADFAKKIGCSNLVQVPIEPREFDLPFRCHDNCSYNPVTGYYFVRDFTTGFIYAYKHSVLLTDKGLIDVTPVLDNRTYNIFGYGPELSYQAESLVYLENCVFINKERHGDQDMYYVYGLVDPRTNLPFYIGKGKDNRWHYHYSTKCIETEGFSSKVQRILELRDAGYSPTVIFYAQNIEEEQLAYDIEVSIIEKYGRLNYEDNGILTNITIDSRPPNWKGKSYIEIYGYERGLEIKERKAKQQRDTGGYFRGHKHTEDAKKRIGEKSILQAHTEEEMLDYGKSFCLFFDREINVKKWYWWANNNGAPPHALKYKGRFNGKCALKVFGERFNAIIKMSPLLWFYHPQTMNNFRCTDWELKLNIIQVPKGYIRGRGVNTFTK